MARTTKPSIVRRGRGTWHDVTTTRVPGIRDTVGDDSHVATVPERADAADIRLTASGTRAFAIVYRIARDTDGDDAPDAGRIAAVARAIADMDDRATRGRVWDCHVAAAAAAAGIGSPVRMARDGVPNTDDVAAWRASVSLRAPSVDSPAAR